jgi:hypothetical protein
MVSRAYSWIATGGGAWSLASNWYDVTDGIDPSLTVPGTQDSVTVAGPSGSAVMTLTGQGVALSATFGGNTILAGSLAVGSLVVGAAAAGGLLDIGGGGALSVGTLTAASGSVIAAGTGSRIAAGTLVLGAGQSGTGTAACNLYATSGGAIQATSLALDAASAAVYADSASSIEVGTLGGAAPGRLTVDTGAVLSGQGNANAYSLVANNGTIAALGGTLMLGQVAGQGLLAIGAGAELILNGAAGPAEAVSFAGAQATLGLAMELNAPQGLVSGFAPGDAIDELGSSISAATYSHTGASLGVLTLYYANQVAGTLTLAGNYAGDVFLTAGDGAGGTLITVAPATQGGGGASPGTSAPDQYLWTAAGGGSWNSAANWQDVSAGQSPAHIAPGVNDLVTISVAQAGGFAVIAGPANAAWLGVTGNLALGGTFAIGTLALGQGGTAFSAGVLDLLPGAQLAAGGASIADGAISVSGSAVLTVAGTLALGGGPSGVGLPVAALNATAGGIVTAAGLTLGGGSGDTVTTDPSAVIEVGAAGGAFAGAVTVDAGATLSGNGAVNPFGAIVDNGTVSATGGVLALGSVTGTGVLQIAAGAGLALNASTGVAVSFAGAGGLLELANERVVLGAPVAGFVPGETIDILNDPVTSLATASSGGNTSVSLYYGAIAVGKITFAGLYGGYHFMLAPDGNNGTDLVVVQGHGAGGGGGQGNTDLMAWAAPGSGAWDKIGNWYDVTTGARALAAPGTENAVELIGAQGAFQDIGGPGVCASLACFGDTMLMYSFTTGTLLVGGSLNGTVTAGILDAGPSSGVTATTAGVDGGVLLIQGAGTTLSVAGTLALGGANDGTLALSNRATAVLGSLVLGGMGGSVLTADITASAEIGTLGSGALGAVTVDAGFSLSGFGAVNPGGAVVNNGTVTAQGGTLDLGAVSGSGALAIATEATLMLAAGDACPILFAGGATLQLAGSAATPAGVLQGFAPGDLIVTLSSQVSAAAYTPGAGNVGTLSLYDGSAVAGTLLLAGTYAGDAFFVLPDGAGTAIGVQAAGSGPPPGTSTPDNYGWTGGAGTLWSAAANWSDLSAGQPSAAVAPGSHDLVTVQGATGSAYTTIIGPADAASLAIDGNVTLSGEYDIGALTVGQGAAGVLALGPGATVTDATAVIGGAVLLQGAAFVSGETLTLAGGLLQATGGAVVQASEAVLTQGAVLTQAGTASVEIGTAGGAAAGEVTVDAQAVLEGAGAVNPQGAILDQGTITASGGTLMLGAVSGSGVLDIGVNATLTLAAGAAAGVLIDFTGPGALALPAALPLSVIAGFGAGDQILLPFGAATDAVYAATGPGIGVLTLYGGGQALGQLTLLGVGLGQTFALAPAAGGTILTTQTTDWGGGGSNMNNGHATAGGGSTGIVQDFAWWQSLPGAVQTQLVAFQAAAGNNAYVWTSPDGTGWGPYQPGYANIAVAQNPVPDTRVDLPPGYKALLVQGGNAALLTDSGQGDTLLMGNQGHDSIVAFGDGDTLVGGGGNTVFWAADAGNAGTAIYGSGNDTIVTGTAPAKILTGAGGHSLVFLGAASNAIGLLGADLVVAAGGAGANDTVTATGADTVFGPAQGLLTHNGGAGADLLVAGAGELMAHGGAGNGSVIWAGNAAPTEYLGGGGSASVIGGSGDLYVEGGAGAMTVFGGAGTTTIKGAAGPSKFVMGSGNATVTAAAGNQVWLASAANDSLVASGGNVGLFAGGSSGNDVLQAVTGSVTMQGGAGADTFLGGAGSATMAGGTGADLFSFTNGLGGGQDVITGFNAARDQIQLHGYGGYTAALVNGSEVLTLSDGTRLELVGIGSLSGVHISLG